MPQPTPLAGPDSDTGPANGRGKLGLLDATLFFMGGIVGVGIFFTPASVAAAAGDARVFLALWALGGLAALAGALTFAELAGALPRAGGWYVFLHKAFGPFPSFLFAWVVLLVVSTGALAVIASFLADTLAELSGALGGPDVGGSGSAARTALGAASIVALTGLALRGAKAGARFQNACMLVKLGAVGALAASALLVAGPSAATAATATPPAADAAPLWRGLAAGSLPVLFAFGGWQMVCYIATEVRDPRRTLPRAIVLGALGVVAVYLALNLAALRALGIDELAATPGFAGVLAERAYGPWGATLLRASMVVSALGVCLVIVVATPWVYVAMAREGLFFRRFADLHPRTGAPVLALGLQCALAVGYVLWGRAELLVDSVVFVEWIFHALAALALFTLRRRHPDLPRSVGRWGGPLAPGVYLLVALGVVVGNLVRSEGDTVAIGLAVLALGALLYIPWRRIVRSAAPPRSVE